MEFQPILQRNKRASVVWFFLFLMKGKKSQQKYKKHPFLSFIIPTWCVKLTWWVMIACSGFSCLLLFIILTQACSSLQLSLLQGLWARCSESWVLPQSNSFCVVLPFDCVLPFSLQPIRKEVDQDVVSLELVGGISRYCSSKQTEENVFPNILLLYFFPRVWHV